MSRTPLHLMLPVAAIATATLVLALAWHTRSGVERSSIGDEVFASTIADASEPSLPFQPSGGYDADNWVSNERSLQQAVPFLHPNRDGAYIGVGPEQNFTYIAALDPALALIVDLRRDNLLLHLLYKALFAISTDRLEFVQRLFGRPLRRSLPPSMPPTAIFDAIASASRSDEYIADTERTLVDYLTRRHRFISSREDVSRVREIYAAFHHAGPDIRWSNDARSWIPTFRELMTGTDPSGTPSSFLATEERFQRVKRLHAANRIIPIVGDFAGHMAFRRIGALLRARHVAVAAFYASNVDAYLRGSARERYEGNIRSLPATSDAVVIRTVFHSDGVVDGKVNYRTSTTTAPLASVWTGEIR